MNWSEPNRRDGSICRTAFSVSTWIISYPPCYEHSKRYRFHCPKAAGLSDCLTPTFSVFSSQTATSNSKCVRCTALHIYLLSFPWYLQSQSGLWKSPYYWFYFPSAVEYLEMVKFPCFIHLTLVVDSAHTGGGRNNQPSFFCDMNLCGIRIWWLYSFQRGKIVIHIHMYYKYMM